ncbi:hypothetical protein Fot_19289 [Forsythia ovata]|uniref:Uncharacterized protein n=1 Tax=Forsythia ovata TaxID=205694 RepID=A0ABD1VKR1_9LAMI
MDTQRRQRRRQIQHVGLFWTMVIQAIVIYDGIRRRTRHIPRAPHRNWVVEREMTLTRMFGTSDRICRDLLRIKIGPFKAYVLVYVPSNWLIVNQSELRNKLLFSSTPSGTTNVLELEVLLSIDLDKQ